MSPDVCPACGGRLRPTHAYTVAAGKTQTAACVKCHRTFVRVVLMQIIGEATHGHGAYALAKRLKDDPNGLRRLLTEVGHDEGAEAGSDTGGGPLLE